MLVVVVVLAFVVWFIVFLAAMLGANIWPYTVKGPLRSYEENVWMRKALLEYEKQVPPPKRSASR